MSTVATGTLQRTENTRKQEKSIWESEAQKLRKQESSEQI